MRSFVRSAASLVVVVSLAALSAVGCSSSDNRDPPAFDNDPAAVERAAENAVLGDLDIDPAVEPIANESDDKSYDSDPTAELDEYGEVIVRVPPEGLLDNPLYDDEEDVEQLTTLSLSPLITPGELADSTNVGKIVSGPWKCRLNGATPPDCACKGSPLNCQVPNAQPGRNRYLPPAFAAEMVRRVAAEKAKPGAANISPPVDSGKWHVKANTLVYDGAGNVRGRLASPGELPAPPMGESKPVNVCKDWAGPEGLALPDVPGVCAKINFGGKKALKPEGGAAATFVYAFNVLINVSSPSGLDASGWIALSAVEGTDQTTLQKMPTVAGRKITRDASFSPTHYVVKSAQDWGSSPAGFKASALPSFAESKVAPGKDANRKVGDYLLKDGNVWNLAYNTPGIGGVGTDTIIVEHESTGFRRVKSTAARPTLIRVRVYANAKKPSMVFAYGSVNGRFGWVALDAIRKGELASKPSAGSDPTFAGYCTGKKDGTYCNENASIFGYICKAGQVTKALRCPFPLTVCKGPSADGTSILCDN